MPLVLVPLIGAEPVVPIIAISVDLHQSQPRRGLSSAMPTAAAR